STGPTIRLSDQPSRPSPLDVAEVNRPTPAVSKPAPRPSPLEVAEANRPTPAVSKPVDASTQPLTPPSSAPKHPREPLAPPSSHGGNSVPSKFSQRPIVPPLSLPRPRNRVVLPEDKPLALRASNEIQ